MKGRGGRARARSRLRSRARAGARGRANLPGDIQENGIGQTKRVFSLDGGENRTGNCGFSEAKDLRIEDVVDAAVQNIARDRWRPSEVTGAVESLVEGAVKIGSKTILDEIFRGPGGH